MNIGFTKMHGTGNDFIVIDNFNGRIKLSKEQIVYLCDRHKGIGADGVILVETFSPNILGEENGENEGLFKNAKNVDCFMNYINADGTEAKMCGNGIRSTAKFLKDFYLKDKKEFRIATRDGIKEIKWEGENMFSVNMGKPLFESVDYDNAEKEIEKTKLDFVTVGNPFAIAFVSNIDDFDLESLGPKIENHKSFPNRINFELVEIKDKKEIIVKTWERGCGVVLACGTGASAAFSLFRKIKNGGESVTVHLPGGDLFLSENKEGEIIMKGPAVSVFDSMIEL